MRCKWRVRAAVGVFVLAALGWNWAQAQDYYAQPVASQQLDATYQTPQPAVTQQAENPFQPVMYADLTRRLQALEATQGNWTSDLRQASSTQQTIADLTNRLEQAESRLTALQNTQVSGPEDSNLGDAIRERFTMIKDPAITTVDQQTRSSASTKKHWFDKLSIRGYSQFRINETLWNDSDGATPHHVGDSSIGDDQSFLIRRARVILSGDVSDSLYVYIQPDFASSIPGVNDSIHFTQLRDCYGDVYLDEDKVNRLRIGLSKIPYGWENLQSSSNRVPLDRNDGISSSVRNERDLGIFYYYTPDFAQDLFKYVLDTGLKGSGNYGLFGLGFYNGQGGSFREQNDNIHMVARLALPYQFDTDQVVEVDFQAYTGKYNVLTSPIAPLGVGPAVAPTVSPDGYLDQRVAASFIYYPQPFGFQAEWNVGRGPVLDEAQTAVIDGSLTGGYAMAMYRWKTDCYGTLFPFVRYHYYSGGYKSERNAPDSLVSEGDFGVEWQFTPQMELTTELTFTDRTNTRALTSGESYGQFVGNLLRVQFQINY